MNDFLHHLIVVAAFMAAALVAKGGVALLALSGWTDPLTLANAVQVSFGLAAALLAHHRTRQPRPATELARSRR